MFVKILIKSFYLLTSFFLMNNPSPFAARYVPDKPIGISGSIKMVRPGNQSNIFLKITDGHPYIDLNVKIYSDETLIIEKNVISNYLNLEQFILEPFTDYGQKRKIKIKICYADYTDIIPSTVEFDIFSPSRANYEISNVNNYIFEDPCPNEIKFTMQGTESNVTPIKESIAFFGLADYVLYDTRFFDFSKFKIFSSNIANQLLRIEFQVYADFKDSNLLKQPDNIFMMKNIKYLNPGKYTLENDAIFYINRITGMINRYQTINCEDETISFYIPFSLGNNVSYTYKFILHSVGMNYSTYTYIGKITLKSTKNIDEEAFGKILNYQYLEQSPLKDIEYA